ncbi:hypothetical protein [Rothia sp. (in: high G+C Gram-positive bacteria)]|uniref:hypothetical protein n=1 Tax=Rothia sp. (in: high G+C Gram-positive bacteria) TaxID=1885016 RepID=UPI00321707B7
MSQIYGSTPSYHHQGHVHEAPKQQPGTPFPSIGKAFRWMFLAFHKTAVAISWIYILIPFLGWNRYSRIFLGYIALTILLVSSGWFVYDLISGNIQLL